jgi:hypothetical protein
MESVGDANGINGVNGFPPSEGILDRHPLDETENLFRAYLAMPAEQLGHSFTAMALWTAHTHALTPDGRLVWYVSPRLLINSAEPQSGKTRVLELLQRVTHNPRVLTNVSGSSIHRLVAYQPTLLLDEIDTVFGSRHGASAELVAALNAGYKTGATVERWNRDAGKMERFDVFAALALAGITTKLPEALKSRAITITMRRRLGHEGVERYRERELGPAERGCRRDAPVP